jgi:hypothetical protein
MGTRKTQKGSGFFDWLRGRRQTQKVAPAPNIPRRTIKDEAYIDALKRDYVFFYYKLNGKEPPKSQRFLTPAQEAEVRQVLLDADRQGKSEDELVREIFNADPSTFQEELSKWEEYQPDLFLNKNTPFERLAFPVAKSLARFIATIKRSPKNIQYTSNFMVHQCEITNWDTPVKTLSDDYCFSVITPDNRADFEEMKGTMYPVSYILVKPEFFPKGTVSGGPISLSAKRLPFLSFLLDAFRQKGVLEIEPVLKATLQREAHELLEFGTSQPITILVPYYLTNASTTRERFIVVDPAFFGRGRNVVNRKLLTKSGLILDAFTKRKVFFMDPKTMVDIRNTHPQLWLANYGSQNSAIYKTLSSHEKIAFCFLQYTQFLAIYSQNRNAFPTNNTSATARKLLNAVTVAKQEVFGVDYAKDGNPFELAENFTAADTENLATLRKLQEELLNSSTIQTPEDVRKLLSKFARKPLTAVPNYFGPQTIGDPVNFTSFAPKNRKTRIKLMSLPQTKQEERDILMQKLKNAIKTPVKRSILPNFLRTRKAKNTNKQQYIGRIETAKKQLLNFNERYGLASPSSEYGYNFS